jgi:opacity protein-like surface antigen
MKIAAAIGICLAIGAPGAAAQESGATVSASVAVTSISSRTELTFTGSAGYRFNRIVGLEIEVTAVPTLKAPFPTGGDVTIQGVTSSAASPVPSIAIFPGLTYANPNGRAIFFTNNIRIEMPTTMPRLTPYFVAGGGVGTVRHTADLTFPIAITQAIGGVPGIRAFTQPVSSSATDLALTIGGGVAVTIASHLGIDGDLRFFRLLGSADTNAGRFGVGVRYTF